MVLSDVTRNKVTLHVILLGVGGTIYDQYTMTSLLNLGVPLHKVHQLATRLLPCNKKLKQDNKTRQNTQQNTPTTTTVKTGDMMRGLLVERLASGGLSASWIAWLTICRILIISFLSQFSS